MFRPCKETFCFVATRKHKSLGLAFILARKFRTTKKLKGSGTRNVQYKKEMFVYNHCKIKINVC